MMTGIGKYLGLCAIAAFGAGVAPAQALEDPTRDGYYAAFDGKTVAYLPISMGANITASWAAGLKRQLEPLGVEFVIRDGNFSIDATAQAITNLIDQGVLEEQDGPTVLAIQGEWRAR